MKPIKDSNPFEDDFLSESISATKQLHMLGQSIWLDNITRELLNSGTLQHYIDHLSVTGLTSNPTIFDKAIQDGDNYNQAIAEKAANGLSGEALFFELALEDLTRAADLLRPIFDNTDGMDGWVSLEVSPLLVNNTAGTVAAAVDLHKRAKRSNLFIKIPGTPAGLAAIEETIFAGVPVNVTLLFSSEQYLAAAEAYMRGIERRIAKGLDPKVGSVASLFISRWDVAVNDRVSSDLRNHLGIAIAQQAYKDYCELLAAPHWQSLKTAGAQSQRLLWASTGSKDPTISDSYYVSALAAPHTINTIPEKTLLSFSKDGALSSVMTIDGVDAESKLLEFAIEGIDVGALADQLQQEGADAFTQSWNDLLAVIEQKSRGSKSDEAPF
jgi:transaldolase